MQQYCNMRLRRIPVTFGDDDSRMRYEARAAEMAKEAEKKGYRYCVSPLVTVTLGKRVLQAGDEVTESMFPPGEEPGWRQLQRLLDEGRIMAA